MAAISLEMPVGELVRQRPSRSRVLEEFAIDFCCGGGVSLAAACSKRGLDAAMVAQRIAQEDQAPAGADVDVDALSMTELADHIEQTHHAYLRRELPRLDRMTAKVSRVHGDADRRLHAVRAAFVDFQAEVIPHLFKEEQVLFPYLRVLDNAREQPPAFHCGSVEAPIRQMEHEHEQAGAALRTMREATDAYQPPEWACNTYRALLEGLAELERDMHLHVHAENNVLFPKAIARHAALSSGSPQ